MRVGLIGRCVVAAAAMVMMHGAAAAWANTVSVPPGQIGFGYSGTFTLAGRTTAHLSAASRNHGAARRLVRTLFGRSQR